jgi:hypothetical protein
MPGVPHPGRRASASRRALTRPVRTGAPWRNRGSWSLRPAEASDGLLRRSGQRPFHLNTAVWERPGPATRPRRQEAGRRTRWRMSRRETPATCGWTRSRSRKLSRLELYQRFFRIGRRPEGRNGPHRGISGRERQDILSYLGEPAAALIGNGHCVLACRRLAGADGKAGLRLAHPTARQGLCPSEGNGA